MWPVGDMWFNMRTPSSTPTVSTPDDWLIVIDGGHETVSTNDVLCLSSPLSSYAESDDCADYVLVKAGLRRYDSQTSSASSDRSIRIPPSPTPSPSPSPPETPTSDWPPRSYAEAVKSFCGLSAVDTRRLSDTSKGFTPAPPWKYASARDERIVRGNIVIGRSRHAQLTSTVSNKVMAALGDGIRYTGRRCALAAIASCDFRLEPHPKDRARVAAYFAKRRIK